MNHQVQIFQIDRDAKPTDRPEPAGSFEVTGTLVVIFSIILTLQSTPWLSFLP